MIKLVIRFVTLATLPMALIAAPSFTPASAMDGGGGDPAKDTTNYAWPPSYPPSSHPRQSDIMATHRQLAKITASLSSGHGLSLRLRRAVPAVEGGPATVRPAVGSRNQA